MYPPLTSRDQRRVGVPGRSFGGRCGRRLRRKRDENDTWRRGSVGGSIFKRRPTDDDDLVDAEYHDIGGTMTKTRGGTRVITQEDIDKILDKIAASGYQNLSEEEREILVEASRKMGQR